MSTPLQASGLFAQADLQPVPQSVNQSVSQSVIDRIPTSASAAMADQGSGTFLIQVIYAAVLIWIVSLIRVSK
jgi:hypothetical protein